MFEKNLLKVMSASAIDSLVWRTLKFVCKSISEKRVRSKQSRAFAISRKTANLFTACEHRKCWAFIDRGAQPAPAVVCIEPAWDTFPADNGFTEETQKAIKSEVDSELKAKGMLEGPLETFSSLRNSRLMSDLSLALEIESQNRALRWLDRRSDSLA